jgi:hypothetical protein
VPKNPALHEQRGDRRVGAEEARSGGDDDLAVGDEVVQRYVVAAEAPARGSVPPGSPNTRR